METQNVLSHLWKKRKSHEFEDKGITEILENTHIKRCNASSNTFDHDFYENVNNELTLVIQRENYLLSVGLPDNSEPYNSDITTNNVKSSFKSIRGKFTPGPDDILPRMLIEAEEQLIEPTTKLFHLCWENGHNPSLWNKDNKIYIPKPGKENYNLPKSDRPISLRSVTRKMLEWIINTRLIWWLESQFKIDLFQFAYWKNFSTTQALTYFIDSIKRGFCDDQHTVAALIDLEWAFDSVWHNGVLHKLWKVGKWGRMLLFLHSFLNNRFSRSLVNSHCSEGIQTDIRVPQGSLLAVILFIFHIHDMTYKIPSKIQFADDINVWSTNHDPAIAASDVQSSLT